MEIEPGRMLVHYRLAEKIGEGGMGVVWKARDTKLDRDVAVKILPREFSSDKQRLARFEREAKLLATLNHPNVASIHGVESIEGLRFLVLELVEGTPLSGLLQQGPLPLEEALEVSRQVCEGLEAAHAAGVIHRDLKPGNIIVTPDGKAKVLDFGLAKGIDGSADGTSGSDLSVSPTVTVGGTQAGVVMGTAPYMSPEQARGKRLDVRTDIFSFGCVLYECLTGRRAFAGETVTDILSAILQNDPDRGALPERTPRRVRELLDRCLEKNPRNRLHHIGDARIDLARSIGAREWTTEGFAAAEAAPGLRRRSSRPGIIAVALVAAALLGAAAAWMLKGASTPALPSSSVRFSIVPPAGDRVTGFALSPDGRTLYYTQRGLTTPERPVPTALFARSLDDFSPHPVKGVEGYGAIAFSPDGRWIAMVRAVAAGTSRLELVKIPVDGGSPPIKIADWPGPGLFGLVWLPDDEIATIGRGPHRVLLFPADGSRAPRETPLKLPEDAPQLSLDGALPGGRHVLAGLTIFDQSGWRLDLALVDTETGDVTTLVRDANEAHWSSTGHILFSRRDAILAVPFDLERLETTGAPVTLIDGVRRTLEFRYGEFSYSQSGTLVFSASEGEELGRRLLAVSRDGGSEYLTDDRRLFIQTWPSPDGRRIGATVQNPGTDNFEIWLLEPGGGRMQPLLAGRGGDFNDLTWTPGGDRFAFTLWGDPANNGTRLATTAAPGDSKLLLGADDLSDVTYPGGFLPDGSAWVARRSTGNGAEMLLVPVEGDSAGSGVKTLVSKDDNPSNVGVSADGRWIFYASRKSGREDVYVRSLDSRGSTGPELIVSPEGGGGSAIGPSLGNGSQELWFRQGDDLMSVVVTSEPRLVASRPVKLLNLREHDAGGYAHLGRDRILLITGVAASWDHTRFNVVLGFDDVIRKRFAALQADAP